jgi:hypothetical protein
MAVEKGAVGESLEKSGGEDLRFDFSLVDKVPNTWPV